MTDHPHKGTSSGLAISFTGGVIALITSVSAAYITANAAANEQLFEVRQDVAVVEERENNHYLEVQNSLTRIEKKLDLITNGVSTRTK